MSEEITKNEEIMMKLLEVAFDDFCKTAKAVYDESWHQWHITYFVYDYFHFFSHTISPDDEPEALKQAFDYMRLIAGHGGRLNICGCFIDGYEEIDIFRKDRSYAQVTLAYSELTGLWHWGEHYATPLSGGGFAAGLSERKGDCSRKTKDEAVLAACEGLYRHFSENQHTHSPENEKTIARLGRESIEKHVLEMLGRNPHLKTPKFIKKNHIAVQQSLF